MARVLVMTPHLRTLDGPFRDVLRQAGMELVLAPLGVNPSDPAVVRELIRGIDGVIASTEPYTKDVLRGTSVRVIARTGVGYDAIDVP